MPACEWLWVRVTVPDRLWVRAGLEVPVWETEVVEVAEQLVDVVENQAVSKMGAADLSTKQGGAQPKSYSCSSDHALGGGEKYGINNASLKGDPPNRRVSSS